MLDDDLMEKALELAEKGHGQVSPNPMVGAVILKDGRVVGQGYHQKYGGPHAEIHAIREAGKDCQGATLYVTLEPCFHAGKTPPCVDAILAEKFKRVVIATIDPNPLTNGRSITKLLDAGINVDIGILEEKARKQNEVFFKHITTGMPFVIMKVAQTIDSRIADESGHSRWITGEESLRFAHQLRSQADAIIIGAETARKDDPLLTVRKIEGKDPYRIILSDKGKLPKELKLFAKNEDRRTIIVEPPAISEAHDPALATVWQIERYNEGGINLAKLLLKISKENISSVLVEGGRRVFSSFLKHKFVDKIYIAIAPRIMGRGVPAFEELGFSTLEHAVEITDQEHLFKGKDLWISGYPIWR